MITKKTISVYLTDAIAMAGITAAHFIAGIFGLRITSLLFMIQLLSYPVVLASTMFLIVLNIKKFWPALAEIVIYLICAILIFIITLIASFKIITLTYGPCDGGSTCAALGMLGLFSATIMLSMLSPLYSWAFLKQHHKYWKRRA